MFGKSKALKLEESVTRAPEPLAPVGKSWANPVASRAEDRERIIAIRNRAAKRVLEASDTIGSVNPSDGLSIQMRMEVKSSIKQILQSDPMAQGLKASERDWLVEDLAAEMVGYGPLEALLEDDDISEIMVSGTRPIDVEIGGKKIDTALAFRDEETLQRISKRIVEGVGRRVDVASPICDARLRDGSRVNVTFPPIAVDGTALTIRKFRKEKLTLEQLVEYGSLNQEALELISIIGRCRLNVLVSGGTGSGKTTLLNCVSAYIDPRERIVTCEDTAELQLQQPNIIRLETRPAGVEGNGEITMRMLVRNALRMRPDRIIVGEVRGEEAVDLVQAMNTGHNGSMGTVHANDPRLALSRMEALYRTAPGYQSIPSQNIRRDLADSLDIIIHAEQLITGKRVVTHVTEVLRMEGDTITTEDLVFYDHQRGVHVGRGAIRPSFYKKAERYGMGERLTACLAALNAQRSAA